MARGALAVRCGGFVVHCSTAQLEEVLRLLQPYAVPAAQQAVEADLAFHGSLRRLDPMEAAVPEAMAQWVGRPATGPAAW